MRFSWWSRMNDLQGNYQNVSLRMRFALDTQRVTEARRQAMLRHDNFLYNEWGVDRRRNLSLEEFRDVYDGKWFVNCTQGETEISNTRCHYRIRTRK